MEYQVVSAPRRLVSDQTLAELLDCSRQTIWRRVADGTLPGPVKVGGLSRFDPDAALQAVTARSSRRIPGGASLAVEAE